jgi:hypothetical protein
MTKPQYSAFNEIREEFRDYVNSLSERAPWLGGLQERLRRAQGYEDYRIETPVVYNTDLDDIGPKDIPRFIIVADNPGKNEQKTANLRYLVGQSGKLAQGWFRKELDLDFHGSCIIINKTPIHTPKTAEIAILRKLAGRQVPELDALLDESQRKMADFAFRLHKSLSCVLWVSGYGELKPKGLFSVWAGEITKTYETAKPELRNSVWVFRHFSMNQFAIEYSHFQDENPVMPQRSAPMAESGASSESSPMSRLAAIGEANRKRILGW